MPDRLRSAYEASVHAANLIIDRSANVDVAWLLAGTCLYFLAQAVRTRGWYSILRAAYPDDRSLRARDVLRAYFAGAGLNAVLPARGGDVVKLALVHRHLPGSTYTTLVATFVPETLFETAFGLGLVSWALARGLLPVPVAAGDLPAVDVSLLITDPLRSLAILAAVAVAVAALVRLLGPPARTLRERLRQGLAILGSPRRYLTGVVSWQALSRVIRLAALAAFMLAFSLPATFSTALLVMAAQGAGRIIPIAPVSTGLRLAMLSYGFVQVTGESVDIADITAFTFGTAAVTGVTGLAISLALLATEHGFISPRRMLRHARRAIPGAPS